MGDVQRSPLYGKATYKCVWPDWSLKHNPWSVLWDTNPFFDSFALRWYLPYYRFQVSLQVYLPKLRALCRKAA